MSIGNRSRGTVPIFAAEAGKGTGPFFDFFRFQVPTALSEDGTAACAYYIGAAGTWKRKRLFSRDSVSWPKNGPVPGRPVNGYVHPTA